MAHLVHASHDALTLPFMSTAWQAPAQRLVLRPFSAELMHKVNGLASTRASKVEIDALDYIIVARAEVRRSPSSLHEWAMSEPQCALV